MGCGLICISVILYWAWIIGIRRMRWTLDAIIIITSITPPLFAPASCASFHACSMCCFFLVIINWMTRWMIIGLYINAIISWCIRDKNSVLSSSCEVFLMSLAYWCITSSTALGYSPEKPTSIMVACSHLNICSGIECNMPRRCTKEYFSVDWCLWQYSNMVISGFRSQLNSANNSSWWKFCWYSSLLHAFL